METAAEEAIPSQCPKGQHCQHGYQSADWVRRKRRKLRKGMEPAWRDDGQERPKGVHLKDNPGKEQSSEQRQHKQGLQTLEGEDMPGRGLSRHGGGEYEMDTELQTKTVRRLPAWLGCCPELPLSLTAASLLLADTLIPGRSAVGERGCLSLCVCVYTRQSLCPTA